MSIPEVLALQHQLRTWHAIRWTHRDLSGRPVLFDEDVVIDAINDLECRLAKVMESGR